MHTNTRLCFALLAAGCSSSPSDAQLPSATISPQVASNAASIACGEDIAFYGSPTPDLRYTFTYDGGGRITAANGTWLAGGYTEDVVYGWSGDNLTHALATSSYDGSQWEVNADYDADDNLLAYAYTVTGPSYQDAWAYLFSGFVGGVPTREEITQQGQLVVGYDLVYDASNRLIAAIPDNGAPTTWTYDEVARTIVSETGNGAYTGITTYDDQYRLLSSAWAGSAPGAIHGDETWSWNGDALDTITHRSGSEAAPQQLELVQVETLRYDCAVARQHAGHTTKRPARSLVRF